jgi:hypothetical protein
VLRQERGLYHIFCCEALLALEKRGLRVGNSAFLVQLNSIWTVFFFFLRLFLRGVLRRGVYGIID